MSQDVHWQQSVHSFQLFSWQWVSNVGGLVSNTIRFFSLSFRVLFFSGGFVCCFAFLYYSFCACLAPVQSALLSMGMRPRVRVIHFRASHGFFCRVWPHLILFKLSKDVRSAEEKKKRHIVKGTKSKDTSQMFLVVHVQPTYTSS